MCNCQSSVVYVMCPHLMFPYLVCFLSLFNVIISSFMSSRVCLIIYDLPVYISSCLFSLMSSGLLVIPGVSCLVLSCPALMSLVNIIVWVYILVRVFLFLPRVCTVTEDQTKTVSGAHSPRFVFRFKKLLFCSSVCVCLSRGMEVAAHHSHHSPLQVGVGVRRDRCECREPSCPPIAGDIRCRRWLSQARRQLA